MGPSASGAAILQPCNNCGPAPKCSEEACAAAHLLQRFKLPAAFLCASRPFGSSRLSTLAAFEASRKSQLRGLMATFPGRFIQRNYF